VLATVREGLRQAVVSGTAPRARLPDIPVAGKTGTAQAPGALDAEGNMPTHGWFVAYAPAEAPEIAVLVFVEGSAAGSAEGARTAAPIAARIMQHYFGLPVR
jgi:penicillin-binding protein 2